jgi:hypothetical protein
VILEHDLASDVAELSFHAGILHQGRAGLDRRRDWNVF